jgi:hypothetical protein
MNGAKILAGAIADATSRPILTAGTIALIHAP